MAARATTTAVAVATQANCRYLVLHASIVWRCHYASTVVTKHHRFCCLSTYSQSFPVLYFNPVFSCHIV